MATIEFELVRTINAPIAEVFARLADIEGHNDWMPRRRSIRRTSRRTSPGEIGVGTTYEDVTIMGTTPGEIAEYDAPHRLVYHWWEPSRSGAVRMEGWPGYRLEAVDADTTLVRHEARLVAHGPYAAAAPMLGWMARRERTTVLDGLEASFAS